MINEVRTSGLKHQRRSAAMEHYAGLDVSVKETSVCVIDGTGKVIQEVKVATEADASERFWWMIPSPSSGLVSRRDHYRNGFTADWPGGFTGHLRRDAAYEG